MTRPDKHAARFGWRWWSRRNRIVPDLPSGAQDGDLLILATPAGAWARIHPDTTWERLP